jgi:hypothetical protein
MVCFSVLSFFAWVDLVSMGSDSKLIYFLLGLTETDIISTTNYLNLTRRLFLLSSTEYEVWREHMESNGVSEKERGLQEEDRKVWEREQEDRKERIGRRREEERERKESLKAGQTTGSTKKKGFLL